MTGKTEAALTLLEGHAEGADLSCLGINTQVQLDPRALALRLVLLAFPLALPRGVNHVESTSKYRPAWLRVRSLNLQIKPPSAQCTEVWL